MKKLMLLIVVLFLVGCDDAPGASVCSMTHTERVAYCSTHPGLECCPKGVK